eukprot:m51a1_g2655 hypothetical protein (496) ;mRNA; r:630181-631976
MRTGLSELPELPWGSHIFFVHCGVADAAELWVPYIKEGVLGGDKCVLIVDGALARVVRKRLMDDPDIPRGLLDTAVTWTSAHSFDPNAHGANFPIVLMDGLAREAEQKKYRGLRLIGEAVWGPHESEEALIDVSLAFERACWVCSYHVKLLPLLSDMAHVSATHCAGLVRLGAGAARHVVRRSVPLPPTNCIESLPGAGCVPADSPLAKLASQLCSASGAVCASFTARGSSTSKNFSWNSGKEVAPESLCTETREVLAHPSGVVEVSWDSSHEAEQGRLARSAFADRLCTVVTTWLTMHVEEEGAPPAHSMAVHPVATAVAAQIDGFEEAAESMDSADVVRILNSLFSKWGAEAERLSLSIVSARPESLVVIGAPSLPGGDERHTDHCLEFAQIVAQSVSDYNSRNKTDLAARIGVARGPATVAKACQCAEACGWGLAIKQAKSLMKKAAPGSLVVARGAANVVEDRKLCELIRSGATEPDAVSVPRSALVQPVL